jgi:dienelactone hydrolase
MNRSKYRRPRVASVALVFFLAATFHALAQVAEETVDLPSLTMSDEQFLKGDIAGAAPVTLSAKLQIPSSGAPPYPAVILLHGSDGIGSGAGWNWSKFLNRLGIATLRIDSYTARGHKEIYSGQDRVGEFNNVVDTYRAVDLLAEDARIDSARIAVMGFSRGGIGALYSAMTRFETMHGPKKAGLAAHLPFYPPCNFRLEGETEVGPEPIRAFHGEADDWNPLARCRAYLDRLAAAGHDVVLTTLAGAQHSFDSTSSPSYNVVSNAQTSRQCFRREEAGVLVNDATGQPFTWQDDCVETGPAVQYNPAAVSQSEEVVTEFLTGLFGL